MEQIAHLLLPESHRDTINEHYKNEIENTTNKRLKTAFRTNYNMSDSEHAILQTFFKHRLVAFNNDERTKLLESAHPILSSLNQLSDDDARVQIQSMRAKGWTTMTIGDSLKKRNLAADHNCLLHKSMRDQYRAVSNAFSFHKNEYTATTIMSGDFKSIIANGCQQGAHKCDFEADIAFFMHSIYDINAKQMAQIFANHKLKKAVAYVLFPFSFLDENLMFMDSQIFDIRRVKEKLCFHFHDFSFTYVHDEEVWKNWLKTTRISCKNFDIAVEIVRTYGPLYVINFVRCPKPKRSCLLSEEMLIRNLPISVIGNEYCLVPDIISASYDDFLFSQDKIPHLVTPKNVVSQCMTYVQRVKDEGLKYTEVAALLSGTLHELKIGNVVYAKRWEADALCFHRTVVSLFILGAVKRAERTTVISRAFNMLKKSGFWHDIFYCIKHLIAEFLFEPEKHYKSIIKNSYKIQGYEIRNFVDKQVSLVQKVDVFDREDPYEYVETDDNSDTLSSVESLDVKPADLIEFSNDTVDTISTISTIGDANDLCTRVDAYTQTDLNTTDSAVQYDEFFYCLPDFDDDKVDLDTSYDQNDPNNVTYSKDGIRIIKLKMPPNNDNSSLSTVTDDVTQHITTDNSIVADTKTLTDQQSLNSIISDLDKEVESINNQLKMLQKHLDHINSSDETSTDTSSDDDSTNTSISCHDFMDTLNEVGKHQEVQPIDSKSINDVDAAPSSMITTKKCVTFSKNVKGYGKISENYRKMNIDLNNFKPKCSIQSRTIYPNGQCLLQAISDSTYLRDVTTKDVYTEIIHYFVSVKKFDFSRVKKLNVARYQRYISKNPTKTYGVFDVIAYFHLCIWKNNPIYSAIPLIMADVFDIRIEVRDSYGKEIAAYEPTDRKKVVDVAKIYYNGSHFSAFPEGGSKDKFPDLINALVKNNTNFIELSAAPGSNLKQMIVSHPQLDKTFCVYSDGIKLFKDIKPTDNCRIFFYKQPEDIKGKWDHVFCDAARKINSEAIIDKFISIIPNIIAPKGRLLIKTFANPWKLWEFATNFESYQTFTGTGSEVYYLLENYGANKIVFEDIMNANRKDITEHLMPYDFRAMNTFLLEFNSEIKIASAIKFKNADVDSFPITAMTGVAGAAKTKTITEMFPDALYITPSKELRKTIQLKYHVKAYTPHLALKFVPDNDVIVIDEIGTFAIEYLMLIRSLNTKAKIVVMGDKYQTKPISSRKVKTVFDYGVEDNNRTSYTIPQDIAEILNNKFNIHLTTLSTITNALCKLICSFSELYKLKDFQFLTFNDDCCKDLCSKGFKCNTVTTFQGSRDDTVILYISDQAVLTNMTCQPEFVYTALTRCTGKLVLYGNSTAITKYLHVQGCAMTTIEELTNIRVITETFVKDDFSNKLQVHKSPVAEDLASETITLSSLDKLLKPFNTPHNIHYINDPNPKYGGEGVLKTSSEQILPIDRENKVYVFPKTQEYIRHQVSDDSFVTVDTLLKRYTKKNRQLKHNSAKYATNKVIGGIVKALYGNDHSLHHFKRDMKCTEKELREHHAAYVERLSKKMIGGQEQKIWEEIGQPMNFYDEVLTFVNKRQGKYDASDFFDAKLKAGQGVAAFSKKVNLIFASFASLMLDKMRNIAKKNGRKLILATHGSDEEISHLVAEFEKITSKGAKYAGADVEEWDSRFLKFMQETTGLILQFMGCNPFLIAWFNAYRSAWVMVNVNKKGRTSLRGKFRQISGSPFTISENTVVDMGLMYAIFEYINEQYAIFKGDDSLVKCDDVKLTKYGQDLLGKTGHKVKLHKSDVGEFAGFLITNYGFFPDLARKCAKFFGKAYRDQKHFEEAQQSAFSSTDVVVNQAHLEEGLIKSMYHYENKLTVDELRVMFYTLKQAKDFKFSTLIETSKQVLNPKLHEYKTLQNI